MSIREVLTASGPIQGSIRPPGSKSITIRALVAAALATGRSHLYGALQADDTMAAVSVLRGFGIEVHDEGEPWIVVGDGGHLVAPESPLDVGMSGLTARVALVLAAHADGVTRIEARGRLLKRPIAGLVESLTRQGASITTDDGFLPATVQGVGGLWGGELVVDASLTSQFATAVMLAAPVMEQGANVILEGLESSHGYAALTARVMEAYGASVSPTITGFEISGGGYQPTDYVIEPDASSAAYPMVAAAITAGTVKVEGLSTGSHQPDIAVTDVLSAMGCRVSDVDGGVSVRGPGGGLRSVEVDMGEAPDGALAVAVAAMFARGASRISGLGSLRHKESDRLSALATEMGKLGAGAMTDGDSLVISPGPLHSATIDPHDDHRVAMAFGVAGTVIPNLEIVNPEVVSKTWPGYWDAMEALVATSRPDGLGDPSQPGGVIVAIDGPAGSGKSTISRIVAEKAGLPHLDTGAFYRTATLAVIRSEVDIDDEREVLRVVESSRFGQDDGSMFLDDEDVSGEIREDHVTSAVSRVSAYPSVREVLVRHQRDWVEQHGGWGVVEGRDIGSVVFPEATLKIYLDASEQERARRRAAETGDSVNTVMADMARRDTYDSSREASPLTIPAGAVVIDTTDMTFEEVVEAVLALLPSVS